MDLKSLVPFRPRSNLARTDLYPFDALRREVRRAVLRLCAFAWAFRPTERRAARAPNGGCGDRQGNRDLARTAGTRAEGRRRFAGRNVLTIRAEKKVEGRAKGQECPRGGTKLRRVLPCARAAGESRTLDRTGDDVQGRAPDQDPEACADRGQEDRGQRSPRDTAEIRDAPRRRINSDRDGGVSTPPSSLQCAHTRTAGAVSAGDAPLTGGRRG